MAVWRGQVTQADPVRQLSPAFRLSSGGGGVGAGVGLVLGDPGPPGTAALVAFGPGRLCRGLICVS